MTPELTPAPRLAATVDANAVKRAVSRIAPAVGKRSSLPINRCVLIEVKEGRLQLTASDVDFTIRTRLCADSHGIGATVVPFRILKDVLTRMRGVVDLRLAEDGRLVLDGGTRAALVCHPASDFSEPPDRIPGVGTVIDVEALRRVLPAARGGASAVRLEDKVIVAGSPDHLHVEPVRHSLPTCFVTPAAVAAVTQGGAQRVRVRVDQRRRRLMFASPDTEYIVDLVGAPAVDPRDVVDLTIDRPIVVDLATRDLVTALTRLRPLFRCEGPTRPVWLAVEPTQVTLTASVPALAAGAEVIPAEVTGLDDVLDLPFDPDRLGGSLAASATERISIHLRDAHTSAVIVASGDDGSGGYRVVAPDSRAVTPRMQGRAAETGTDGSGPAFEGLVIPIGSARRRRFGSGMRSG